MAAICWFFRASIGRSGSNFNQLSQMLNALPSAKQLLGDKGYDADWFRQSLAERGIVACIPSKSNRKTLIEHDGILYRQRHKIRKHVRQAQGLAAYPYPLRPMRTYLHVRHLYRRRSHLLAVVNES